MLDSDTKGEDKIKLSFYNYITIFVWLSQTKLLRDLKKKKKKSKSTIKIIKIIKKNIL
jgi:guanylate kinase